MRLIVVLIMLLALIGIADSAYMTLVHYRAVAPGPILIEETCTENGGACQVAAQGNYSAMLGVPHSVLGLLFYGWLVLAGAVWLVARYFPLLDSTLVVSWMTVLFSVFLAYTLIFTLKTPCVLCFVAHGLNLGIAVLLSVFVARRG